MKHPCEILLVFLVIATWDILTTCCPCGWFASELKQHPGRYPNPLTAGSLHPSKWMLLHEYFSVDQKYIFESKLPI